MRRRWLRWVIALVVTVVVLAVGWVVIRGIGAVTDLQRVADSSSELKSAVSSGDLERAEQLAQRIAHHARSAHDLTSDPVWGAFTVVPWLGPNFSAVSEVAAIADDVAAGALDPVLAAAADLDFASLGLSGGAVDLTPFEAIERPLAAADETLAGADARARSIDADAALPPLTDAVRKMRGAVSEAATVVGTLHGAAQLLPGMLGGGGPRSYVVAMQNNAELRSSGGIVGAIALLQADGGRITLTRQASTRDFPPLDVPLPTSDSATALFEDRPGRFIQNTTSIPDFPEAAALIASRWQDRFGTPVDGVIAVDAVMTRHLLAATGPLTFGPFTVDEHTVVDFLLSGIYAAVPDPAQQDEVFAQAATALFGAALSNAQPRQLLDALVTSAQENRIRIWSAHAEEEDVLGASTLGGGLPVDGEGQETVGVLLNDTTGGKMDFYTDAAITTAVGVCDGETTTQVRVTWTNNAPADAATALPPYVTASGWYGVPPGSVRTLIAIYGPEGATPSHIDRDGADQPVQTALLGDRSAVQHEVLLAPGESTTITIAFTGATAGSSPTMVAHTPMVRTPDIQHEQLRCVS